MKHLWIEARSSVQATLGLGLYVSSWLLLIMGPVVAIMLIFQMLRSAGSEGIRGASLAGSLAAACGIGAAFYLMGLLLRWLARGVLQWRKARMVTAAALAVAAGVLYLLDALYAPFGEGAGKRVDAGAFAVLFLLGAAGLLWMLTSASTTHEA